MKSYSKEQQTGVKAGTPEAAALLKRAFGGKKRGRESKDGKGGPNKYFAEKTRGAFDRTYDSKTEADYAMILRNRMIAGEIADVKCQKCLHLVVNGETICDYFMDFMVTHNDGRIELIEVKGFPTPEWKKKWNLTRALLPTGQIPGIPPDSKLTLTRKGGRGFIHDYQVLNYGENTEGGSDNA